MQTDEAEDRVEVHVWTIRVTAERAEDDIYQQIDALRREERNARRALHRARNANRPDLAIRAKHRLATAQTARREWLEAMITELRALPEIS